MNEDRILSTIEELQAHVRETERELSETKRTVNHLCRRIGRDPIYRDTDASSSVAAARSDEFYGKALASVVRTVLERRAAANLGAASVDTIFGAMRSGGYLFNAKNDTTAKTALATSLAKNTSTFHKLPNGDFGLLEWYPSIPAKVRGNGRNETSDDEAETERDESKGEGDGLKEPYKNEFAEDNSGTAPPEAKAEKEQSPRRRKTADKEQESVPQKG